MEASLKYTFYLILSCIIITNYVYAESLVEDGIRELEELKLQQLQTVQDKSEISAFTTDGCSGGQSQNWTLLAKMMPGFDKHFGKKPPWEPCCVAHDKHYWRGVVKNGYMKRKEADIELMNCVERTGEDLASQLSAEYSVSEDEVRDLFNVTAKLMYQAVRLGGQPCSLLPWRWGYGWGNCILTSASDTRENNIAE